MQNQSRPQVRFQGARISVTLPKGFKRVVGSILTEVVGPFLKETTALVTQEQRGDSSVGRAVG